MTLIVGCISCLLAVVLSSFTADIAEATSRSARAQMAADAAALAAVQEAAPFGGGDPRGVAGRFASLNEAELLECICPRGATAVQVRVSVDGIAATARAVMDPEAIGPGPLASGTNGLDPRLRVAVDELVAAARGAVTIVSGFRSPEEQAALWADALRRYGSAEAADNWVAPPGHSMHERGLAVDLGGDLELAVRLVDQLELPLHRPLANEPWHFELTGSR